MRRFVFVLLSMLYMVTLLVHGKQFDVHFYDKWANVSSSILFEKGERYLHKPDMQDSALVCYSIITNRYYDDQKSEKNLELVSKAFFKMAYLYMYSFYDYHKASEYLFKSQEMAEAHNIKSVLPYIYLNLANLETIRPSIDGIDSSDKQVFDMYGKAYYAAFAVKDWKALNTIFFNMLTHGANDDKMEYIRKEIDHYKSLSIPRRAPLREYNSLLLKGIEALKKSDYNRALSYFEGMDSVPTVNDYAMNLRYRMAACSLRAQTLFRLGREQEALSNFCQMEKMCTGSSMQEIKASIYKVYSNYYYDKGEKSLYNDYLIKYLVLKDSLMNKGKLQDVEQMRFLYELKKVNDQVQEMSYERTLSRYIAFGVSLLALAVVVILILVIRNYRQVREKNRQLYRQNLEMLKSFDKKDKYKTSWLDDDSKQELREKVLNIMDTSDEIYKDTFSLNVLAELVDSKPNYVSQVVNETMGKNFNVLLNEYRIKEVCRRMNDIENFGNYTIEGHGIGVGFKSRSNFVTVFKKVTGLNPSEYISLAHEKDNFVC